MKGRELCRQFYEEHGAPTIETSVPEALDRLAVGIVVGSQAHGNDDEFSRDHGWGPGFSVWFSSKDFVRLGSSSGNS